MLQQVISVSLLSAMAALSPAASQGIARGASIAGTTYTAPATRVLVATPYPSSPGDSLAAVQIGNAVRDKMTNKIGGSDWAVITRQEMNRNFQTWGYNADQLFQPESARQVASAMQARMFVMTTLTKGSDGLFNASIRVTGIADDAGQVASIKQVAGQTGADFGGKIAELATIIFRAYPDAKSCMDNMAANKAKAVDGANKSLKLVPTYGLAEYCLGLVERAKDSVGTETARHFKNATVGDPLSLRAVNQLAIIHQLKHDTAGVIEDYQRMITIAPTNQPLASEAIKIFKAWGRPDAADQVVAQQRQLDPTSPDWPHLQGTSCAAAGVTATDPAEIKKKYACAYAAFVEEIKLDPTRADTNFFPMIVFVAGTRADSMEWARKWADKYPNIEDPYTLKLQIYMDAGQTDSALTVVNLLNRLNPANTRPALAVLYSLMKAKRYDDAVKMGDYFQKNGDENAKNQYAGLLVTYADSETRRTPKDDSVLVHLGRALIAFNAPNKLFTEYGHYFTVLGLSTGYTTLATAARNDKSCETVKRYTAFVATLDSSVVVISASSNSGLSGYGAQLTTQLAGEKAFIPQAEKAFCKPATKP